MKHLFLLLIIIIVSFPAFADEGVVVQTINPVVVGFLSPDFDGDGLLNSEEGDLNKDGELGPDETSPFLSDTDGDGIKDNDEKRIGTHPNACDSDEDGLSDGVETGAIKPASDGVSCHGLEAAGSNYHNLNRMDPLNPDSDGDGLLDGEEDANGNGWLDTTESDPSTEDTDRDGLEDGVEATLDFDGDKEPDFDYRLITAGPKCSPPENISDLDCDGLPNWMDVDSDDDGCPDSEEGGRKDSNSNGITDVYDNEAKDCSVSSGGGGNISFGNGTGTDTTDEVASQPAITHSGVSEDNGGGACSLLTSNRCSNLNLPIIFIFCVSTICLSSFVARRSQTKRPTTD